MLEMYERHERKALTFHKCDFCELTIYKGEKYIHEKGKCEGEFFKSHKHIACDNMITDYCGETGEYEYTNDDVKDWLADKYCYSCSGDCDGLPEECWRVKKDFQPKDR